MKTLRARIFSFVLDLLFWAYLFYGLFTLHYLYTRWTPWRPEEKFVLPTLSPLAWFFVFFAITELTILVQAFGPSLGHRVLGIRMVRLDGGRPALLDRLRFYGWTHVNLVFLGLGWWLRPELPLHEAWAGVRFEPVPPAGMEGLRRPWYRAAYGWMVLLLFGLTFALGWRLTEIDLGRLIRDANKSIRIWSGLVNPDFRYLVRPDPRIKLSLIDGLVQSLYMALLATVAGTLCAGPLSFLAARNVTGHSPWGWPIYVLIRGFFNVFRSVETIFWAAIFAIWVGWGPFAGTLALFIHTVAALGKLFSEQVEHIDPGPVEAVAAAGANLIQIVRFAMLPQVIPQFLALAVYRWDINLRMATVVALVGGGGIGRHLFEYKDDLQWGLVGAVIIVFVFTVWLMDYVSGWIREKIV